MSPLSTSGPTGWSLNSKRVTTPKLPLPPRRAQKRSGFSVALARTTWLAAVTTSADSRLSMVHSIFAAQPAESAAQCQAGDAGGGVDADGRGEGVGLGGGVEVGERGAALDRDAARSGVDPRGLHLRKVDDDTVVAHG